jgi:hypothetical protein
LQGLLQDFFLLGHERLYVCHTQACACVIIYLIKSFDFDLIFHIATLRVTNVDYFVHVHFIIVETTDESRKVYLYNRTYIFQLRKQQHVCHYILSNRIYFQQIE